MDGETLGLFRTTHTVLTEVQNELRGQALRESQLRERVERMDAETAELRDEVHALANRVEALTHAMSRTLDRHHEEIRTLEGRWQDEALHSVKVPE